MEIIENSSSFAGKITDYLSLARTELVDGLVLGRSTWLSRKIEVWTESWCSPTTAKVVQTLLSTLPFIVMSLFIPTPLLCIGSIILIVFRAAEAGTNNNPLHAKDIFTGPTLISLAKGASFLFTTHRLPFIAAAVASIAIDFLVLYQVGFIGEVFNIISAYIPEEQAKTAPEATSK
ncbi:MAG: hypothetical protein QRY74_01665 [Chlamydia sp.]